MSDLEATTRLVTHQQNALTASVGEIKAMVDRIDSKLDGYFERVITEHAEPEQTPAGRRMLAVTTTNGQAVRELGGRVDSLETFRDELRGALGFLRVVVTVSTVLSAVAVIISALHAARLL